MTNHNDESTNATSVPHSDGDASSTRWTHFERPSTAVVEAVAKETGRDVTAVEPLQRSIDTDALDALVTASEQSGDGVVVPFEYEGVDVRLNSDGTLDVNRISQFTD